MGSMDLQVIQEIKRRAKRDVLETLDQFKNDSIILTRMNEMPFISVTWCILYPLFIYRAAFWITTIKEMEGILGAAEEFEQALYDKHDLAKAHEVIDNQETRILWSLERLAKKSSITEEGRNKLERALLRLVEYYSLSKVEIRLQDERF